MAPEHSDLSSDSEGKEDTEQVNGGIGQIQTAEHETLLDKEPVGKKTQMTCHLSMLCERNGQSMSKLKLGCNQSWSWLGTVVICPQLQ